MPFVTAVKVIILLTSRLISQSVTAEPLNLTLTDVTPISVTVTWDYPLQNANKFEITVTTLDSYLMKTWVNGSERSLTIGSLHSGTVYHISVVAVIEHGESNVGEKVTVLTQIASSAPTTDQNSVFIVDVIIVLLILIAWICSMALFLNKWGKLRLLEADQPRYNHRPKNIENIKVVKRSTDSIIHRNYSTSVNKTMAARQKRLERMHTMPNIKFNIKSLQSPVKERHSDRKSNVRACTDHVTGDVICPMLPKLKLDDSAFPQEMRILKEIDENSCIA